MLSPKFCDFETKHLPPFHRFTRGIAVKEADTSAILNPGSWSDELVYIDLNVLFLKQAEDPVRMVNMYVDEEKELEGYTVEERLHFVKHCQFFKIIFIYLFCVCVWKRARTRFSPSTTWALGIERRS